MSTFPKDPFEQERNLARAFQDSFRPRVLGADALLMEEGLAAVGRRLRRTVENDLSPIAAKPYSAVAATLEPITVAGIAEERGCHRVLDAAARGPATILDMSRDWTKW